MDRTDLADLRRDFESEGLNESDMPGPWDGPVRVAAAGPTGFSFVTLDGHLEAGRIDFRTRRDPDHPEMLRFDIESWARPGDRLSHVLYNTLRVAKEVQFNMVVLVNLFHDAMYGPQAAWYGELFDTRLRYSGASLGYQIGSVIGGTTPLVATALLYAGGGTPWLIWGYFGVLFAICIVSTVLLRETHRGGLRTAREKVSA